jgi:hypothetical protein
MLGSFCHVEYINGLYLSRWVTFYLDYNKTYTSSVACYTTPLFSLQPKMDKFGCKLDRSPHV